MKELMISIKNVSKEYRLGEIGGTTLKETFQRINAKIKHKEDPTKKIGAKNYNKGEKFFALNDVSFEVKKGERVGIIGHNGAGKSTLLKLISRITCPTKGEIGLNGRVSSMLEIGTGFHAELTGRENVYMNGAILGMTKKEIDSKIDRIIDFSEIREFIDTPVKRYSSGMFVKLAFSVAAHLDSEIMIMDEVLAVGDMAFQKKCIDKMNQASIDEGKTILYVSHNMETIRNLCTKCIVLEQGKIIFDGDVETGIDKYLDSSKKEYTTYIDCKNIKRSSLCAGRAIIDSITFSDTKDCVYKRGEKVNLKISWQKNDDIKKIRFGISISINNGARLGTAFSAPSDFKIGGNETMLSFDFSKIINGIYDLSVFICYIDKDNNLIMLDDLPFVCKFEIKDDFLDIQNINNWGTRKFGYQIFPEIEIKG